MKKKLDSYSETLYHLITFRCRQYVDSRLMIGIDYDTFMILSCVGSHYLTHNTTKGSDWDSVWLQTRTRKINDHYSKKKLTIYAVANIMDMPKETVRRKVELLKKKKLIIYSSKMGLIPTDKVEETIKPFAKKELVELSIFLQSLNKNKTLDQLLNLKNKDL